MAPKKSKQAKLTLYAIMKDIFTDKTGTLHERSDFKSAFSKYMVIRFLSMRKDSRPFAEIANQYQQTLTEEELYKFLVSCVPYSSNSFVRYIKK